MSPATRPTVGVHVFRESGVVYCDFCMRASAIVEGVYPGVSDEKTEAVHYVCSQCAPAEVGEAAVRISNAMPPPDLGVWLDNLEAEAATAPRVPAADEAVERKVLRLRAQRDAWAERLAWWESLR